MRNRKRWYTITLILLFIISAFLYQIMWFNKYQGKIKNDEVGNREINK